MVKEEVLIDAARQDFQQFVADMAGEMQHEPNVSWQLGRPLPTHMGILKCPSGPTCPLQKGGSSQGAFLGYMETC